MSVLPRSAKQGLQKLNSGAQNIFYSRQYMLELAFFLVLPLNIMSHGCTFNFLTSKQIM